MLGFLTSNASKVYHFFGDLWGNATYILEVIYTQIFQFFIYTLPNQIAPLFPYTYRLIAFIVNTESKITTFIYSYYNFIVVLVGYYYSKLVSLAGVMYADLQTLVFSMYSILQSLVFSLYTKITHLTITYYNKIITLAVVNYNALLIYAVNWFYKASYIFDTSYTSLVNLINSALIGNITRLMEFLPSIINLASLPFYALWFLTVTSYNVIKTTVLTLEAHAVLLATSGVALINTLFPLMSQLLRIITGDYWTILGAIVSDFTKGFPMIRGVVRKDIEAWLGDSILSIIEKAIDRFW